MSNVFELEASVGLDTTKFKQGIKEAMAEAEKLRKELEKTGTEADGLGKEVDKEGKEAEKSAEDNKKLGREVKTAGDHADSAKSKFEKLGDFLKTGLATAAKAGIAATGAAVTGIGKVVKDSVGEFAEYEQLVGGIKAAFAGNQTAIDTVLKTGEEAWSNLTMSSTEFYDSFMAAYPLIKSGMTDENEAISTTNRLLQLEADLANTFGYEASSAANAINWALKGSYNYLDNLNIGIKGTKEGFLEAANASGLFGEEITSVEQLTTDDIVSVIEHFAAAYGVMGRTQNEAAGTLQGSMKAVKATWKNLLVEMTKDNGDINGAFENLFNSVSAMASNTWPRIERAIGGVGNLITTAAPQISKAISTLIPKLVPSILKSGVSLVSSVTKGLVQAAPELLSATSGIVKELFNGLMGTDWGVFDWLKDDISHIVDSAKSLFNRIDFEGLKDKFVNIGSSIGGLFEKAGDAATYLFDHALSPLAEWVTNSNFLDGIAAGFQLIGTAVDFLKTPAKAVWEEFLQPILSTAADVWDVAADGLKNIGESLKDINWEGYWIDMFDGHFGEDWKLGWQSIYDAFAQGGQAIDDFFNVSKFGQAWNEFWQGVGETVFNIKTGIMGAIETMESAMERVFGKIKETDADFNTDINTGYIVRNGQVYTIDPTKNPEMYKKYNPQAYERWYNQYGSIAKKAGFDVPTPFANGGRVTRPTLALIGEKEPETVVPDSKRGAFGNTTNYITINIDGYNIKNDEEFTELLSRKLSELSVRQQRAVGGAGW